MANEWGAGSAHSPHARWWASSKRCPPLMVRRDSSLQEGGLSRVGSLSASLPVEVAAPLASAEVDGLQAAVAVDHLSLLRGC